MRGIKKAAALAGIFLLLVISAAAVYAFYKTNGHPVRTISALSKGKIPARFFVENYGEAETILKRGGFAGFITEKGENYIVVKTTDGKMIRHVFDRGPDDYDIVFDKKEYFGDKNHSSINSKSAELRFEMLKVGSFVMRTGSGEKEELIVCSDVIPN